MFEGRFSMFQLPVVVVQASASVFASVEECVWTFRRFGEVARAKEARLIVFPELAGLMLAPALMAGVKSSLARTAGRDKERQAPLLQKARGLLAGSVAGVLRANMSSQMARWFNQSDNVTLLEETYRQVFSQIASELRLTVVAGSCYCMRPPAANLYNTAHVFGPDGKLLGVQSQTHLLSPVLGELSAGDHLMPIQTELGALGLLVGNDVLFPETARILAYQGAEVLISLNAAAGNLAAAKLQHAFQARVAENEVYGVQSYLVGRNMWAERSSSDSFVGKSMIAGPMELVPRPNGVMAEMGESVQGVLAGVLDITGLHRWWADGATSVRRAMRPGVYQGQLSRFYRAGQTIHAAQTVQQLTQETISSTPRMLPWAGSAQRRAAEVQPVAEALTEECAGVSEGSLPVPPVEEAAGDFGPTQDAERLADVDAPDKAAPIEDARWSDAPADSLDEDDLDANRQRLWD
jgi:predicted amidohydrolase